MVNVEFVHQRGLGLPVEVCLHSELHNIEGEMGRYKHFGVVLTGVNTVFCVCELFASPPLEARL